MGWDAFIVGDDSHVFCTYVINSRHFDSTINSDCFGIGLSLESSDTVIKMSVSSLNMPSPAWLAMQSSGFDGLYESAAAVCIRLS